MSHMEIAMKMEDQAVNVNLALSVLAEAQNYFATKKEAEFLPYYADQINNLLIVTTSILREVTPVLDDAVKALIEQYRKESNIIEPEKNK